METTLRDLRRVTIAATDGNLGSVVRRECRASITASRSAVSRVMWKIERRASGFVVVRTVARV
jgi:hypothetical protein